MLQKFATGLTIVALAAVLPPLAGCVSTKSSTPRPPGIEEPEQEDPPAPSTPAVKLPAEIHAVGDWDLLPKDVRQDVVEGDLHGYKTLALSPKERLEAVTDPEAKTFAGTMVTYMRTHGDMTVQDATHARVGDLVTWVQIVRLDGKTILGGAVTIEQAGCDMPDESAGTFKSAAEAGKAGCVLGAGTWSAEGSFNHDGTPFAHGDYMEWSGK